MSTQALERLVTDALHAGDTAPVDLRGARAEIARRVDGRQHVHRQVLALVAAVVAVVALVLSITVPLVLSGRGERPTPPVGPAPTKHQLSPSGLPVGVLEGKVDRSEPGVSSTVRLVVRPDGTGTFNAGTVGDVEGDSVADYEVQFVWDGRNRAAMRFFDGACLGSEVLTLQFTVRDRAVVVDDVGFLPGCLVSRGLESDLPGTVLRILPLPLELSPSGLPVGVVRIPVRVDYSLGTLRLLVRADGTGQYRLFDFPVGDDDSVEAFDVEFRPAGPGRADLAYQGTTCVTLDFSVAGGTLTFGAVRARGCLISSQTADRLEDQSVEVEPLPQSASLD